MAYLIGPSEASRLVFTIPTTGADKDRFKAKRNRPATYYVDPDPTAEPTVSMLTTLAEIRTLAGEPIEDSTVTTDAYSMLPLMRFPEGTPPPDSLLVTCDGGPPSRVYAREDDRLDAVSAAVTAEATARANADSTLTTSVTAAQTATDKLYDRSFLPLPLEAMTVTARGSAPIPTEWFGGYFWATDTGGVIKRSADGVTWTLYCTVPNVQSTAGDISRILRCDDGEVLVVSTLRVQRSTGWASGSPTWTTVLTNPTVSFIYPWGADGDGTKFIINHYAGSSAGSPDRALSRYGWISTDGGHTFTVKWDSDALWGSVINALTHLHGCAYDSWADRFYMSEGHDTVTGIYYSDDDGDTWTKLTYGASFDVAPGNAPTTINPTDNGVVFGTDDATNGVGVLRRGSTTMERAWSRLGISNTTLLGYAHMGARDPRTGLVYVVYEANTSSALDLPCQICGSDGQVADAVWSEPTPGGLWRRVAIDDQGRVLAWEQRNNQIARGYIPGSGARPGHLNDTGRVLGGTVSGGRKSVAVGAEARATGDSAVAVGGGATTSTHNGTAVGAGATAIGSGQAFGNGATADALGTAVGYQASTTNGLASGYQALAPTSTAVAVGRGARAATDANAAVSNATAVGRDAKANAASGNTTAIGYTALASGAKGVAVGSQTTASGVQSTALGEEAVATGTYATAVGQLASAANTSATAIGQAASASGSGGLAVGAEAVATVTGHAVGYQAVADASGTSMGYQANTTNGTAVGYQALAPNAASTAVGRGARAATDAGAAVPDATAIGRDAKANASGGNTVAIGNAATASGTQATAVGETATASASTATALGQAATASHAGSVALGQGSTTTAASQVQMGARHIELVELAADPAAPTDAARLYAKDDGGGATGLYVRYPTGSVAQLYTGAPASPLPSRAARTGSYLLLNGHPVTVGATTAGAMVKDQWRWTPIKLAAALPLASLTVLTTVAASGGTAAMIFALHAADSSIAPAALVTDLSTYGSLDLTTAAGAKTLATAGLIIPAGEYFLGCAWTGTATTSPTITLCNGWHPSIADSVTPASINRNGYVQSVSGATPPSPATPSGAATQSVCMWGALA